MLSAVLEALSIIATPTGILVLLAGALVGLAFGILPGLGASQAMILLLPFTYGADPHYAILFFVAIMSTASFGGALPAILINTPGTPANVCTTFDGHALAQRGQATRAIYIASASCLIGSVVGAAALFGFIPVVSGIITAFGAKETFWLVVFGIAMISLSAKGNTLKGLVAGCVGLLLAFVGRNYVFPGERFTGGASFLYDGIPMAALLVGLFAVAPMVLLGAKKSVVDTGGSGGVHSVVRAAGYRTQARQGLGDVWRHRYQAVRGSGIGVALGIIPAVGGATASFINYLTAKQLSRNPDEFGRGSPEGLIASETANDAKDGGALMPTLAFGIPGDPNTAVLLGALLMHGVALGRPLFEFQLPLVMVIVLALVLAQVIVALIGAGTGPIVARLTQVPSSLLVPVVIASALIGSYLFRGNIWDLTIVLLAAALAYLMTLFGYPVISLVLGYFLGTLAERSFIQTLIINQRDATGLFQGWIVWTIIGCIIASFLGSWLIGRHRTTRTTADNPTHNPPTTGDHHPTTSSAQTTNSGDRSTPGDHHPATGGGQTTADTSDSSGGGAPVLGDTRAALTGTHITLTPRPQTRLEHRLGIAVAALLLAISAAFLLGSRLYDGDMGLFPRIIAAIATALMILVLASELSPRIKTTLARIDAGKPAPGNGEITLTPALLHKHLTILLWVAGFIAVTVILGFLALPLAAGAYVVAIGRFRLRTATIVGLTLAAVLVLFGTVGEAQYWPGILPTLIPGYLGGGRLPILF